MVLKQQLTINKIIEMAKNEKNLHIRIDGLEGKGFEFILSCDNFSYTIGRMVQYREIPEMLNLYYSLLVDAGINIVKERVELKPSSIYANARRCHDCKQIIKSWPKEKRENAKKCLNKYKKACRAYHAQCII